MNDACEHQEVAQLLPQSFIGFHMCPSSHSANGLQTRVVLKNMNRNLVAVPSGERNILLQTTNPTLH